nr:hypothetical protein HK105_001628 [Polyrhizophydium stewartii]
MSVGRAKLAINVLNAQTAILPDVTVTAVRHDQDLSTPGMTYRDFLALAKTNQYSIWAGPISSELTAASSLFSSYKKILSFSPTANSTTFSDKTTYPYFWRYTSPVENLAYPAIALMRNFNWTDVVLTWVEGTEGASLADVFSSTAISNNMTMVAKVPFSISSSQDLYMQALGPLKFIRSTKARIIVLAGGPSYSIDILLCAARLGMIGNGFVWITLQSRFSPDTTRQSAYWGRGFNPSILKGVLQFRLPKGDYLSNPSAPTIAAYQTFNTNFNAYRATALSADPSFYTCFSTSVASTDKCFYPDALYSDGSASTTPAFNVLAGYDGIMTAALAMDIVGAAVMDARCELERMLTLPVVVGLEPFADPPSPSAATRQNHQQVVNSQNLDGSTLAPPSGIQYGNITLAKVVQAALTYPSLTGVSKFTTAGDPGVPYELLILKGDSWTTSTSSVSVGTIYIPPAGVRSAVVTLDLSSYFWQDGRVASSYVPPQYPVLIEEFISWDTADTKAILGIYVVFWVVLFVTLVVLAIKCTSPDVKNASPNFLFLLTLGLSIASLNILTLPGKYKPTGCLLRPWPLSAGMSIVLSALLAKTHHIYYVYDNVELYRLPTLMFNSVKIYTFTAVIFVLNAVLLISYTAKAPLQSGIVYDDTLNKNTYACIPAAGQETATNSLLWLTMIYNFALLAAAITFAFWIRNAPAQMGNARQLGYVVYISALLTLIVMVGGFSGVSTVKTEFFVESIVVLFGLVTIYGFLVAVPLFSAVTGYVSKTLPGMQSFGGKDQGTSSAMTTGTQSTIQPVARGMRGRKKGSFKIAFRDDVRDASATLQSTFESINGTFHLREGYLQCTTNIVPTWAPVTVTLILEGLNLLLCVSGSDDQTTEFNMANLIAIEVLDKHPTESAQNCLVLKQATQTHILQLKSFSQVYVLALEIAKKMIADDADEQRAQLNNSDRVLKSVTMLGFGESSAGTSGSDSKKGGSGVASKSAQKKLRSTEDDDDD